MKPNGETRVRHRKLRGADVPAYYGVVLGPGDRVIYGCPDDHPSPVKARECARDWLRGTKHKSRRSVVRHAVKSPSLEKPRIRRSLLEGITACSVYQPSQSLEAGFGQLVHDCLYTYILSCWQSREESRVGDVDRIAQETFYASPRGLRPEDLDEAKDLLDRFARTHVAGLEDLLVAEGRPAIEHELAAEVNWCVVIGTADRIDRIDGDDRDDPPTRLRIVDYKTQWSAQPFLFQGRTYSQLAFLTWPSVEEIEWYPDFIRLNKSPDPILYRRGDLDEWWGTMLEGMERRWQLRQSGAAQPTGGVACQYCALRYSCGQALPSAAAMPETLEQATELLQDWVRLGEAAGVRKDGLEHYFEDREPAVINGYEVGFLTPRKPTWRALDMQGVVTHLTGMGLDGKAVLATWVDTKKVPPVCQEPLVQAGVARWDPGKISFRRRKAGEDE